MTNGKAVREAMETVKINSPAGPLSFDKDHGVVFNVYLLEVRKGPDGIVAQIPRPDGHECRSASDPRASAEKPEAVTFKVLHAGCKIDMAGPIGQP